MSVRPLPTSNDYTGNLSIFPHEYGTSGNLDGTSGFTVTGVSLDGVNFTPVTTTDPSYQTSTTLMSQYVTFAVNADGTAQERPNDTQALIDQINANQNNTTPLTDKLYYQVSDGTTTVIDSTTFTLNDILFNGTGVPYSAPETVQPATPTNIPGLTVDRALSTGQTSDAAESLTVNVGLFDFATQKVDGMLGIDPSKIGAGGNTGETITVDPTDAFHMITISGTIAQINADLQGLTYTNPNTTGDDTIAIQAIDAGAPTADYLVGEIKTACYCAGTLILTDAGEVPVEALKVGDLAVTASGERRPIVWLGRRHVDIARHPRPDLVRPIRIEAGALGDALPRRDLLLSPEHALWFDGVLVPAETLVNGATIRQEAWSAVDYFHVELESHDILVAEGVPAESYLDCDNRGNFDNAPDGVVTLHPDWSLKAADRSFGDSVLIARLQAAFAARAATLGRAAVLAAYAEGRRALGRITRSNNVRNPRAEGSRPGVLGRGGQAPTHWWMTAPAGIDVEVIGSGGENGLPYFELRLGGRAETAGQVRIYPETGRVTAEPRQDWSVSCHLRRTGGSLAGIEAVSLYVDEYGEGGAYVGGRAYPQSLPGTAELSLQRLSATRTLAHRDVVSTTGYVQVGVAAGVAIDVTLRLAGLQIEQGSYASDLMLPPPGELRAVTRHGPAITVTQTVDRQVA